MVVFSAPAVERIDNDNWLEGNRSTAGGMQNIAKLAANQQVADSTNDMDRADPMQLEKLAIIVHITCIIATHANNSVRPANRPFNFDWPNEQRAIEFFGSYVKHEFTSRHRR